VTGDEAVVVVVPRLTASLHAAPAAPPLGDAVWGNTALGLPEQLRDRAWRCELTREPVVAGPDGSLAAAQVLRLLPVALLVGRK
jgi:maltooligosyltrehalose synthase